LSEQVEEREGGEIRSEGRGGKLRGTAPLSPGEIPVLVLTSLALVVLFVVMNVLTEPDARGHGTHEQLGMAPCSWPILYDKPCPTCGVTTSVSWLSHGRPFKSFMTQPFGFALGVFGLWWIFASVQAIRRRESLLFRLSQWPMLLVVLGITALVLIGWAWVSWMYVPRAGG
jgi:hypothetical protein